MAGPHVCVVTVSGSLGVMAADACTARGLELPNLLPETVCALREIAPAWMNVKNPLDVGPSGIYAAAMKSAITDPQIDGIIAVPVIPEMVMHKFAIDIRSIIGDPEELRRLAPDKPIVFFTLGGPQWLEAIRKMYGKTFPLVSSLENAARALSASLRYGQFRTQRNYF